MGVDGSQPHELRAVVVADAEGYSRLMASREAETHTLTTACLKTLVDLIGDHGGALVKTTGDGAMVEFPSAIAAVQYGIAVQNRLKEQNAEIPDEMRPRFRIGVHLGEIMREGGDIYGHSVNVAARMESYADPDGICVSEVVYDLVKRSLPVGFESMGTHELRNLDTPLTIYKVLTDLPSSALNPSPRTLPAPLSLPDRPSIAVMPFTVASGNEEGQVLAQGLSEDIATCLGKFEELFVISPQSSSFYEGRKRGDVKAAQELGVRYLLEGGVRISGERLRVRVVLIDSMTGRNLWSEKYDRQLTDIFAVQDDVAFVIVSTLAGRIKRVESSRRNELVTQNLKAYGEVLQAREHLWRHTPEDNARAQIHFLAALDHDAEYAPACAGMARARNYDWQFSWGDVPESGLEDAVSWAQKAVSLDRSSARAHAELGFSLLFTKKQDLAIAELREALELNPNDCDIMAELADTLAFSGQPDEALDLIGRAMRLNPSYPDAYLWYQADAHFSARSYNEVVSTLARMTNPNMGSRLLAASHGHLGQTDKAAFYAKEVMKTQPGFSVNAWVATQPEINAGEADHLAQGLLKAGLPA